MARPFVILVCLLLTIACGSSTSTSTASKRNVNSANSTPSPYPEDAYRLASWDLDIAPLQEFVGKTASEMKLWQNKEVVRQLKNLMGDDFATMRKFWNRETPLKKFADTMMLTGCEENNCDNNKYIILLSTSEGLLKVVRIRKDSIEEWQTRQKIFLPPPIEEDLAAMMASR